MESLENRLERLELYLELLLKVTDLESQPFYKLVISKNLNKKELAEVYSICEELAKKYEEQKKQGLIDFVPLLTQFVGQLPYKLNPHETIYALQQQKLYPGLMDKLASLVRRVY
ncbi:DUF1878 family protein [Priestia filamentosa]|uniref:DUF1878 family protein n=1 Tax=Priestia filamentosa TaxID=1402861 RepID=UPI001FB21B9E|nr:DUF1878 family protein [Priestia filamentosa]MED3726656.1 DUF1878 family protein [Priestia filamentosa]UOE60029.1 DUF1878 family protein [Priestia filamentosa]